MGTVFLAWSNILGSVVVLGTILGVAWRIYQAWDDLADRVSIMVEQLGKHVRDEAENTKLWRDAAEHRMTTMEGRLSVMEGGRPTQGTRRARR